MKKRYKKPQMEVVKIVIPKLLSGSGNSGEFGARELFYDDENEEIGVGSLFESVASQSD